MTLLTMTSCRSDEVTPLSESDIIGSWRVSHVHSQFKIGGETPTNFYGNTSEAINFEFVYSILTGFGFPISNATFDFMPDKTYKVIFENSINSISNWMLNGTTITLVISSMPVDFEITVLTNSSLTLRHFKKESYKVYNNEIEEEVESEIIIEFIK